MWELSAGYCLISDFLLRYKMLNPYIVERQHSIIKMNNDIENEISKMRQSLTIENISLHCFGTLVGITDTYKAGRE